jgi:hypothetical protein
MLLVLSNKLKEAHDRGQSQLMLFVRRGARNAGLSIAQPEFDLTEAVPDLRSGGEAVALFDRLWREGYISLEFGSPGPQNNTPTFLGLTTKGLIEIAEWPDPDEWFTAALEAARDAVKDVSGIPEQKKRDLLDTLTKLIALANGVRGLGEAIAQTWTHSGHGGPG